MNLCEPPLYGTAVFGTSDGLQVQGNGLLASKNPNAHINLFELRGDGGPGDVLHYGSPGQRAMFRRPIVQANGRTYELLGHVAACKDVHGRAGYYGSCVIIDADQLSPEVRVYEWSDAFKESLSLLEQVSNRLDEQSRLKLSRSRPVVTADPSDAEVSLRLASPDRIFLHPGNLDPQSSDLGTYFRARAFMDRSSRSVFLFEESLNTTRAIDEGNDRDLPTRMESRIEELRQRRDAQKEGEVVVLDTPRAQERNLRPQGVQETVEQRLDRLERRIASLEQQTHRRRSTYDIHPPPRQHRQQPTYHVSGAEEDDPEFRSFLWYIFWAGSIVALLIVSAYLIMRYLT